MGASSDDKGEDGEDNSKASPADQLNERLFAIVTHTHLDCVYGIFLEREKTVNTSLPV